MMRTQDFLDMKMDATFFDPVANIEAWFFFSFYHKQDAPC